MSQPPDVLIAGGGVMGSATACFLALDPAFDGRVLVVERDPSYADCATTRSLGGLRQQFSTPENIAMSLFGLHFVRNVADWLAVDGEVPQLSFHEHGYLFLATEARRAVLEANHAVQRDAGADVELLEPGPLADRFPWLNVDDLSGASFGRSGEGWIDPYALLQGFRRKARSLGVEYVEDTVTGIQRDGPRITGVTLAGRGRVPCGLLVNAAGPQAGWLAALAGVDLPVRPRKRHVFVFACRESIPRCPLVIDPSGVYFRPEGANFLTGTSPPADRDPDSDDLELDHDNFEHELWPVLAARVPAFEAIKPQGGWAGHYDFNTVDHNAIIGRHPEVANLYLVNGFSGHGLQQSPAAGRALAELIAHGAFRSIDLTRFRYERFAEKDLVVEQAVV